MKQQPKHQPQTSWAEICCLGCSCLQLFWPRVVMRKWLNISAKDSDFSADTDEEEDEDNDSETEALGLLGRASRFRVNKVEEPEVDRYGKFQIIDSLCFLVWCLAHSIDYALRLSFLDSDGFPWIRRRKSETFRAQYINTKEIRICVGTWNVGGILPTDDLDIESWMDINQPADIYVLGQVLQEIVPLNAGNIFGAEDNRPVTKWENIIRQTLNRIRHEPTKIKCFSDPPSPSKFKPSEDIPDIEEEILLESDSDLGEEVQPLEVESNNFDQDKDEPFIGENMSSGYSDFTRITKLGLPVEQGLQGPYVSPKRLDRLKCLRTEDSAENVEAPVDQYNGKLARMLSGSERVGLSWPEAPLNLLSQHILERPNSLKSIQSFKASRSSRALTSIKSTVNGVQSGTALLADLDLESLMKRRRRSPYVRIVSKQMVGIFISVWVRRSLRRHIQNLRVSTVGVGVMGYIGNKGSVSVSMSIYQTFFCFICAHLTSGEKDGDELKRNADVHEIHRRTLFHSVSGIGLPKSIYDHERIIWLGDLNYRINLSYEGARELISQKEWSQLVKKDQLVRELRKGRAFDGWSEGNLNFPPTYKYEVNSDKYHGEDPKAVRRTPSWCDRILSYGKGMRLLSYRRTELKLSDHRPVTATYMAEVEVFCPRKLQRALTFTDAEIENKEVLANLGNELGAGYY
ncbi:Exo_endo_phos domain-containing protein [Cephalotus follicularis]|uniref:Exo_endo_phos domain-containing protein n=1 Tax=Cephalotus follicularis TaxID=3775 RepID=A0A1Q3BWM9_CEPFO|nr:Exo_endo_phos domain-containing protein [Cephalotus follicularis]